jgi:lipopolysaccharide transport system ATP-binding protein
MSDIAISAENLSKQYFINVPKLRHDTLRDRIVDVASGLFSRNGHSSPSEGSVWALSQVSFEITKGEVVAIIGRNGAGKSTLLKILSRVTKPTSGSAVIHGRVGSLLEVGTGFHPELTGRENIYLSGAVLGMRRAATERHFDEIVDFSGVDKYIDTPVKRYSSGMFVRLAFAVAAHLDSDILIVDEALAVGDAAFQKKCLGKMGDIAKGGRTILLVSHNMGFVSSLTQSAMVLENGRQKFFGDTARAVPVYLANVSKKERGNLLAHENRAPGMRPAFISVALTDGDGRARDIFSTGEEWRLEMEYACVDEVKLAGAGFTISTSDGILVGELNSFMCLPPPHRIAPKGKIRFCMPELPLCPGSYTVSLFLVKDDTFLYDRIDCALDFSVEKNDPTGTGFVLSRNHGLCALKGSFEAMDG